MDNKNKCNELWSQLMAADAILNDLLVRRGILKSKSDTPVKQNLEIIPRTNIGIFHPGYRKGSKGKKVA